MKKSLCFVSITGAVEDIDRFCDAYLKNYDIHLKRVLRLEPDERELLPKGAFFPFTEVFPDREQADFFAELKKAYYRLLKLYGSRSGAKAETAPRRTKERKPIGRQEALSIYEAVRPLYDELAKEKSELKAELLPKEESLSEGSRRLPSLIDPEEKLRLSRELNELHGEISSLRQAIYEVDLRLAALLRERADDLRASVEYFELEEKTFGIRDYAAIYRDSSGEEHFLICGFMRSDKALELSIRLKTEGAADVRLKTGKELSGVRRPLTETAFRIYKVCPEALKNSRLLKCYEETPFENYWDSLT